MHPRTEGGKGVEKFETKGIRKDFPITTKDGGREGQRTKKQGNDARREMQIEQQSAGVGKSGQRPHAAWNLFGIKNIDIDLNKYRTKNGTKI